MKTGITLPKLTEALTNGLNGLKFRLDEANEKISKLEVEAESLRNEITSTEQALKALQNLQTLLGERETITFRFPD